MVSGVPDSLSWIPDFKKPGFQISSATIFRITGVPKTFPLDYFLVMRKPLSFSYQAYRKSFAGSDFRLLWVLRHWKARLFLFGLKILSIVIEYVVETVNYNTYVASIYAYNTRKRLHIKKRFNSHKTGLEHVPTWPPFHCFLFVFVSLANHYFLSQTSCENARYI